MVYRILVVFAAAAEQILDALTASTDTAAAATATETDDDDDDDSDQRQHRQEYIPPFRAAHISTLLARND